MSGNPGERAGLPVSFFLAGSLLCVSVSLAAGAQLALVVLLVTGIHFIEAYGLNPAIYSAHLKLHPLLVLSVLVIAEHSLGVWGLLLAGACSLCPGRLLALFGTMPRYFKMVSMHNKTVFVAATVLSSSLASTPNPRTTGAEPPSSLSNQSAERIAVSTSHITCCSSSREGGLGLIGDGIRGGFTGMEASGGPARRPRNRSDTLRRVRAQCR